MKSYEEIKRDITSLIPPEVSGVQLEVLTNILSRYCYDIQAVTVSQLIEGTYEAVNYNSLIKKAESNLVSVPRVVNPEVTLYLTSLPATHSIKLGDIIFELNKYKLIYLGYFDSEGNLIEADKEVNSGELTKVKCLITEGVTIYEVETDKKLIYDFNASNICEKVIVHKNNVSQSVFNNVNEYDADDSLNKIIALTGPDFSVKFMDYYNSGLSTYKVILPKSLKLTNEVINLMRGKKSSKYLLSSQYLKDTTEINTKITNLGSDSLSRSDLAAYIQYNAKRTQLIKSNTDILTFFEGYLRLNYNLDEKVNFNLGSDLLIYVSNLNFIEADVSHLKGKFYLNLSSITIKAGIQINAKVNIKLNNQVSEEVSNKINQIILDDNKKFNSLPNEFLIISKIHEINPLIRITDLSITYTGVVKYLSNYYTINLSKSEYELDVANYQFEVAPDISKVYKLYSNSETFLIMSYAVI